MDPDASNTWAKAADLNKARNRVGGAVLNSHIYIAGGSGGGPGGLPPPNGKMPVPPPNGSNCNGMPPGPPPGQMPQGHDDGITLEVFTLK